MTIVVTAISKNNAGNRTSATELPMVGSCGWPDCCCVAATGTFSGSAFEYDDDNFSANDHTYYVKSHPFETCWQAYFYNKPLTPVQLCWTKAYSRDQHIVQDGWRACKPEGGWKIVNGEVEAGTCGEPCQTLENAC